MCESCNANYIKVFNVGMNCHEFGCPDAWKDEKLMCKWCGCEFIPEEKQNRETCSHSCMVAYNGFSCDCEECIQGYPEDEDFGQDGQVD
jgi:hypothetical protein